MCDFPGKPIAWMDHELPESEAADLERHVAACAECRERLAAYECASNAFNAYCEATFAAEKRRKLPRWLPAAGVAAGIAAAAAIAALLMLPRQHVAQVPPRVPPADEAPRMAARIEPPPAAEAARPAHSAAAPIMRSQRQYASAGPARSHDSQRATAAEAPAQASQVRNISPFPAEPPIRIAIPADAMFPPGAVPPGMSFTAELTISADGSAERLGLRPRLAGFERRANQP
jgi:hypothetical protein